MKRDLDHCGRVLGGQYRAGYRHSVTPRERLTGLSLRGIDVEMAGTAPGFQRYSPALKSSNVVWNAEALDAWLADPARRVPYSWMALPGVKTDASPSGPSKGQPVLLPAGMQGERASVIFGGPAEISAFIRRTC